MHYYAEFRNVEREIFNSVADRVNKDNSLFACINVRYAGNNLRGDVCIDGRGEISKEFKKALQIFMEEYCK